ncbi:M16 family metallopeptidase [Pontibaca methylaminivorans]|uniref:Zinc protease n=1 Tax=Pontibaca methylaminivorans TaxID=515897 RepID=A0A1R3WXY8_9RHOB|nr:pitrilysin family protein [Pontibaca methylaminivorans]SIT83404.1 zinc protease [Pontibaca methylaminivorans]
MRQLAAMFCLILFALPARAEVDVKEVTSPGGITAWLVEEHSLPFTALELRFRGGTSLDPGGRRGAVYLMTGLLEEGAGDMDARAFARALEAAGASIGFDSGDDMVSISTRFLSENRNDAMALLRTALHEPRFDEAAIDRVRAQVLSGLASERKDPNAIAGRTFAELTFDGHPYGSNRKGTAESVRALTRDDMIAAHGAVFARDRLYVGAVGDIDAQELGELLDDLLGDLPEQGARLPPPAEVAGDGGTVVVDYDTPQSVAVFGQEGLERDDPDFYAAYVLNQILGGGSFESRLMQELRVKRGLTYGVYTYLAPKDLAALYMGGVASANDRIAEAVEMIRQEWADMAENGVSETELARAKTYLTGAYPLRFDGNGQIARILVGMQMDDLPIDYIATRNDRINAVTLDEANRVARELLRPGQLRFVVVGQPEGLDEAPRVGMPE